MLKIMFPSYLPGLIFISLSIWLALYFKTLSSLMRCLKPWLQDTAIFGSLLKFAGQNWVLPHWFMILGHNFFQNIVIIAVRFLDLKFLILRCCQTTSYFSDIWSWFSVTYCLRITEKEGPGISWYKLFLDILRHQNWAKTWLRGLPDHHRPSWSHVHVKI